MTTTTSPSTVPGSVRRAHLLWLLAVTAGVYESGLAIAHGFAEHDLTVPGLLVQLAVRGVVLGGAVFVSVRMRDGSNTARWALALVLGGLGLASLLVGPVEWLAAGNGPSDLDLAPLEWVFAASRVVHMAAVLAATVSMFTPEARAYFSRDDRPGSRTTVTSAPAAMIGSGR